MHKTNIACLIGKIFNHIHFGEVISHKASITEVAITRTRCAHVCCHLAYKKN